MTRKFFLSVVVAMMLAGCAASDKSAKSTTQPHAECPVCKHNADLACVEVAVNKDTPCCMVDGKTTYFCSEACKKKYVANPQKYPAH